MQIYSDIVTAMPQIKIEQISNQCPAFKEVLRLRALCYGRNRAGELEDVDKHSLHFIARNDKSILGALRVTCKCHGLLESERFYPPWILEEFGDRLCASSRMCVVPEFRAISKIPFELTKFAWSAVLQLGVRIDVSKARLKAIPYYIKMGYFFLRDSYFDFQQWDARCGIIAFPANAQHKTKLAEVFQFLDDPFDLSALNKRGIFTRSYREFSSFSKIDSVGSQ